MLCPSGRVYFTLFCSLQMEFNFIPSWINLLQESQRGKKMRVAINDEGKSKECRTTTELISPSSMLRTKKDSHSNRQFNKSYTIAKQGHFLLVQHYNIFNLHYVFLLIRKNTFGWDVPSSKTPLSKPVLLQGWKQEQKCNGFVGLFCLGKSLNATFVQYVLYCVTVLRVVPQLLSWNGLNIKFIRWST